MKTFTLLFGIIALFATSIAGATTHVVKSGDNLYRIARTYNVSLSALQQANPGVDAQSLHVGRQIVIPKAGASVTKASTPKQVARPATSGTYAVVAGDSLSKIARNQGTTVAALQAANPSLNPNALRVGQKINLSGNRSSAVAKTTTAKTPAVASTSSSRQTETTQSSPAPTSSSNKIASSSIKKQPVTETPVDRVEERAPAASLDADSTVPINNQKTPAPASTSYVLIKTTREQTLAEVATEHETTPEKLNALNGWSFSPQTLLAVDSELYVPAQP